MGAFVPAEGHRFSFTQFKCSELTQEQELEKEAGRSLELNFETELLLLMGNRKSLA